MFLKIGHRGAKGYAPENTLAGFKKAISLGVDAIELDLRRTKDGKIVVFHDKGLKRLCKVKGKVADKTLEELKKLRVKGEQIPTFEEVLKFAKGKVKLDVEIKIKDIEEDVVKLLRKHGMVSSVVFVCSFYPGVLGKVKELCPKIETCFLFSKKPLGLEKIVDFYRIDAIGPVWGRATKKMFAMARKKGLKFYVWTVNSKRLIEKYKKWKIDGIISDYPDKI
ncbi:glycerophosphodiester phosphodiesterase [archaeon]|nr:glycerophosphodiester phosphodiesterase [archaeon]MBT4416929.1 glycerophosphodiester phosphodiesterase [archaeon]